jgi:hypothetical protein
VEGEGRKSRKREGRIKKEKLDKELKARNNLDDDANDKPKRALTKYQQYIRDNQQRIRYEFPKLSNTERFSKLAKEWKDSVEKAENAMSKAHKDRKNEYIDKNEYIETWLQQGKKKIENAKLDKEYAIKNNLFKASPKASAKASPKASPKASAKASPKASAKASPKASAKASPKASAKASPKASAKSSSHKESAKASAKSSSHKASPKASPINRNEMNGLTMEELFAKLKFLEQS